jgi:RNA polymerase sigma-70 factor (ECF subfamily)
MEASDEELMLAYRDGNGGAFDTLYARHKGALFRYVLRGVKFRAVAEELYQEIWIRVIEARRGYAASARFTSRRRRTRPWRASPRRSPGCRMRSGRRSCSTRRPA